MTVTERSSCYALSGVEMDAEVPVCGAMPMEMEMDEGVMMLRRRGKRSLTSDEPLADTDNDAEEIAPFKVI